MSGPQKVVVVVLVGVVGLFVVALAFSSGSGEGHANEEPGGLVGLLGDRFGGTADVAPQDLTAPCLQPNGGLVFTGGCTLTVAPGDGLRTVRLRAPQPVRVVAEAPNDDFDVEKVIEPGEEVTIAVDAEGGQIGLGCQGVQACQVTLGTEP